MRAGAGWGWASEGLKCHMVWPPRQLGSTGTAGWLPLLH